jgi:hypothetical protein
MHLPTPDVDTSLTWLERTTGQREQSKKLLALSDGLPLLAHELYCSGGVDEFAARRSVVEGLIAGRVNVPQACSIWGDLDTGEFLEQLTGDLQSLLKSFSLEDLRTKQAQRLFGLLDEIAQLRRAVSAGSNPSKQLLVEALLSKVDRRWGEDPLGDSIRARIGDPGV